MMPWNPFRRAVLIAQRWARLLLGLEPRRRRAEAVLAEASRASRDLDPDNFAVSYIPLLGDRWAWAVHNLGRQIAAGESASLEAADQASDDAIEQHMEARYSAATTPTGTTCPWCDERVHDLGPDRVNRCPKCGHRADLPPASCDCDRCDGFRAQAARCRG